MNDGFGHASAVVRCSNANRGDDGSSPAPSGEHSVAAVPSTVRDLLGHGARIRFSDTGTGPGVLLLHDFLESREVWEGLTPKLSRAFRVVAPDLPGFGESERPSRRRFAYTPDALVESLVDLLSSTGLGRMVVGGQGLGAALALLLAARAPDAVAGLVLMGPWRIRHSHEPIERLASVPLIGGFLYRQLYGRRAFHRRLATSALEETAPEAAQRHARFFDHFDTPAGREAAFATLRAMGDGRPFDATLPRVRAPTLLLVGKDDASFTAEEGRRWARTLPQARVHALDFVRSPHEECLEPFLEVVEPFLSLVLAAAPPSSPKGLPLRRAQSQR